MGLCSVLGEVTLDSKKYPTPEQRGGEYVLSELSLHRSGTEKVLQVPAAYWEGGCLPTAVGMVFMYWEMKGLTDLLPGNNGFHFESSANIVGIASNGYYNDYYYPEDTDYNILSDRSETDPSTWRNDDCIADALGTSRSRLDCSTGATLGEMPQARLPYWATTRNSHYISTIRSYGSAQLGSQLWQTIVKEIDGDRPLIAYVNSTRGSSDVDHAVTVVGYGEQDGTRFYYALNTWDFSVHRYVFGTEYERNQWGIGDVVLFNFSAQSPLAEVHKFYNPTSGAYFFSMNEEEVNTVKSSNPAWSYLGAAFKVESENEFNNVPVYRFYNFLSASHFYTANESERDTVIANLSHYLRYEGIAFYVRPNQIAGTLPVYRFYLPKTASHYFTIDEAEKEQIRQSGDPSKIQYEGIAWFSKP